MFRIPSPVPNWATIAGLASCAIAGAPAAANAETVSKLPGTDGLPFPARFIDASTDGRFVLLQPGAGQEVPSAPEAAIEPLAPYALRDRIADTTTRLDVRIAPGEAVLNVEPVQVSDDGDRVLVQGNDSRLSEFVGYNGTGLPTAVYDRSEDRLLRLPTTPNAPPYGIAARLSADGTTALVQNYSEDYLRTRLYRGPIGGAGTVILDLPGASLSGASSDLQTVLYQRPLITTSRPIEDYPRPSWFTAKVIGAVVGNEPPRILFEEKRSESPTPGAACDIESGISVQDPGYLISGYVAPNGGRAAWTSGATEPPGLTLRAPGGGTTFVPLRQPSGSVARVTAFGNANQVLFDPPLDVGYVDVAQELVDGDTELITSRQVFGMNGGSIYGTRYVEATPYSGAPVPTPAPQMTFTNEPVDSAGRTSQATWYSCPDAAPTAPVGTFDDYVRDLTLYRPFSARYTLGTSVLRTAPSSALRRASKITAELTIAGVPYWKKTVTSYGAYAGLPKPLAWLPMTLKFTVQFAATPGQPAPAPLVRAYSVWTTRTN